MIDVMKRLAELDATNPNIVKESAPVQECGPMGMMDSMPGMHGMMADKPSVPANFSINASAATGNEVADMMSQILTLAGMKQVGADDLGAEPQGAVVTAEPAMAVGPAAAEPLGAADSMRSVLDKLNPEPAGGDGEELGPFQHDSQPDGGDDEMGPPEDDAAGDDSEGDDEGETGGDEGDREETDETADSAPNDPNSANPFDSNEFAHQENQPGSGETSNGEKRQSNLPTATFEALMKEYKQFIGEAEEDDEEVEEGKKPDFLDLDKDGNKKEPMKKAAKEVDESIDILKLAGLK